MTAAVEERTHSVETYRGHRLSNDGEDAAHIVDQRADSGQDVAVAYIEGLELTALCGHRWTPTKDPQKLPLCRACVEVLTAGVR